MTTTFVAFDGELDTRYDFHASVPQLFWNIIPPWGPYGQAAVVHDMLCRTLTILQDGKPTAITRARCDQILMEAMTVLKVPAAKRWMIYSAVCAYRIVSRTSKAVDSQTQRELESDWLTPAG